MTKIKITVLKVFTPEDVFGEKFVRTDGTVVEPCHLKEGQEFLTDGFTKPEGFCNWAFADFRKDFYLLAFGGEIPGYPTGVIYTVCSDGKRPVCFKLERLEE
ncbi:MAG: TIGR04076 family protein [Candidatus Heimdallarchaeota archaeon]|nr:TIGR04076 family protein [Candidatus Heimdallarchaeota archaeon]MCK4290265.1 TIGR04076 family protein [Candidatus Heimdallarchaeota archaeon]